MSVLVSVMIRRLDSLGVLLADFGVSRMVWRESMVAREKVAEKCLNSISFERFWSKLLEIWMTLCNFVGEELRCHVKETENREE